MKKISLILIILLTLSACETEKTFYIADHYGKNGHLLFRESPGEDWKTFTGKLEGFEYSEGYEYKVKVKITGEKNHPEYHLISVESKTKTDYTQRLARLKKDLEASWTLTELTGIKNPVRYPVIKIQDGQITGLTGCNKFFGKITYGLNGDFHTSSVMATKKFCAEYIKIERLFNRALQESASYSLKDNVLTVTDKNGNPLFTARRQMQKHVLDGNWVLTKIENFLNTTGTYPDFQIEGNSIKGNTGCNQFSGELHFDRNNSVTSGAMLTTKKYCARTIKVEKAFLTALKNISSFKTDKDLVHFYDVEGNLLFTAMLRK